MLASFSVLVYVLARLKVSSGLPVSFAAYGALHALALVLALQMRQSIRQMSILIAMAAALSVMALRIGIKAIEVFARLPAHAGLYVLGCSAMIGALTYGILIRLLRIRALSLWEIIAISIGCTFATYVAFFTAKHFHLLSAWWLAIFWWHAFSGGLWYFDYRQNAARLRRQGHAASAPESQNGTVEP